MRIKDFLNEFEADRAALPGVEKETLAKLRNKTVVISGGELARCLCYAFLYNNEAKRLGIKVILLGKSRNAMASYHSELLLRDDFDFVDYNSASEISSADYVITTGICGEHTDNNPQIMIDGIAEINACAKITKATGARVVVVNDSRIYGKAKPHRVYSENEYAELDATSPSSLAGQLMRTRETALHSVLKNSESTVTTLRTGIILGASSNFTSVLDPVFDDIANRRDTVVPATRDRCTFVYINDVLMVEEDHELIRQYVDARNISYKVVGNCDNIDLTGVNKILAIDDNTTLIEDLQKELAKKYEGKLYVIRSTPRFCEFSSPSATKGNAVRFLAEKWGINKEEIMACGDQDNDIEMLLAAGVKVAMGNATEDLKKIADYVTETVDNDGVACAVAKFIGEKYAI